MTNIWQEEQNLTEKVLNIKYALDKLEKNKQETEASLKIKKDELEWLENKIKIQQAENEKISTEAQELLVKLDKVKNDLATQQMKYAEDITQKQEEIRLEREKIHKEKNELSLKEDKMIKRELSYNDKETALKTWTMRLEMKEKELQEKEDNLINKSDRLDAFAEALSSREQALTEKNAKFESWEKSLQTREDKIIKTQEEQAMEKNLLETRQLSINRDYENIIKERADTQKFIMVLSELQWRFIDHMKVEKEPQKILDSFLENYHKPVPVITPKEEVDEDDREISKEWLGFPNETETPEENEKFVETTTNEVVEIKKPKRKITIKKK